MKKHIISEGFAKTAIYFLFALSIFACGFFVWDARSYQAAQMPGATPPAEGSNARPQTQQAPGPGQVQDGSAQQRQNIPQNAPLERALAPNWDELNAELLRLEEDMGISVPVSDRLEYMGEYHTTAYCCEEYKHICGGNGVTASGTKPTQGLTCAADWDILPPGTWLYIRGVGIRRVEDSGSAILGKRLDVAVDTHENALRWRGFGRHEVWVLYWPDEA